MSPSKRPSSLFPVFLPSPVTACVLMWWWSGVLAVGALIILSAPPRGPGQLRPVAVADRRVSEHKKKKKKEGSLSVLSPTLLAGASSWTACCSWCRRTETLSRQPVAAGPSHHWVVYENNKITRWWAEVRLRNSSLPFVFPFAVFCYITFLSFQWFPVFFLFFFFFK